MARSVREIQRSPDLLIPAIYDMKPGGILLVEPAEVDTIRHIQSIQTSLVPIDNYVLDIDAASVRNLKGQKRRLNILFTPILLRSLVLPGKPCLQYTY